MGFQGTRHQIRITLGAADPLVESLPVSETLYHHPEAVGLCGLAPYYSTDLEFHTNHILHVGEHPNLVKHLHKYIESPMHMGFLR